MSIHSHKYRRKRDAVRRRDHGTCIRCQVLFNRITPATEVDHLVPRSKGGDDSMTNLWMLCGTRHLPNTCHGEKSLRETRNSHDIHFPFAKRVDPKTGWDYEGDDLGYWQAVIKQRNMK